MVRGRPLLSPAFISLATGFTCCPGGRWQIGSASAAGWPMPAQRTTHGKAAIHGAGIAGLTAPPELVRRSWTVQVFEANPEAGGLFRSARLDGEGGTPSIRRVEVWHEWTFSPDGIEHRQPKWANTTRTQRWLPPQRTSLPNLALAGAHTRTEADVWSIEAAVESGRRAAQVFEPGVAVLPQYRPRLVRAHRRRAVPARRPAWAAGVGGKRSLGNCCVDGAAVEPATEDPPLARSSLTESISPGVRPPTTCEELR